MEPMCFDCLVEGDDDDPGCGHPTIYCSCWCHEERDPDDFDHTDDTPAPDAGKED